MKYQKVIMNKEFLIPLERKTSLGIKTTEMGLIEYGIEREKMLEESKGKKYHPRGVQILSVNFNWTNEIIEREEVE